MKRGKISIEPNQSKDEMYFKANGFAVLVALFRKKAIPKLFPNIIQLFMLINVEVQRLKSSR
ncbi:hypothetical protein Q763_12745 [Flavobacterium beibuense F44-8]|uniref:Uncharacterized protein n=1 Tax=Flavobacterium beibuense F44-8 TaxID=1406840 RepID=A0A0A2LUA5_9FLAO|nr:hypothetical protein [Flavobacterium beibuense]KGO79710.1 hypothetical protein Q763_12745 [Flavobacterium beibuense F44-8]